MALTTTVGGTTGGYSATGNLKMRQQAHNHDDDGQNRRKDRPADEKVGEFHSERRLWGNRQRSALRLHRRIRADTHQAIDHNPILRTDPMRERPASRQQSVPIPRLYTRQCWRRLIVKTNFCPWSVPTATSGISRAGYLRRTRHADARKISRLQDSVAVCKNAAHPHRAGVGIHPGYQQNPAGRWCGKPLSLARASSQGILPSRK